jgi:adenylate cyclase
MSLFRELERRNVVRVALAYLAGAWLLIQIADTVLPRVGFSDTAVRNVIVTLAIGFVPALILAWIFELTPEGLRRDRGASAAGAVPVRRLLDRAIVVMLVLAVGYFAIDKFVLAPARDVALIEAARQEGRAGALVASYGDKSIAVLPFENLSSDPEQAYFADGIAEELLNLLAQVNGLRVISRTSAFSFKGQNVDIATIARKLDVAHVLEGSVRRSGDRVRITAQLIDARTDTHLWSETFERNFDDVFAIQDEVASRVTEELEVALALGAPRSERVDPQAYPLYLHARELLNLSSEASVAEARPLFEEALAIDPAYVDAMVGLSVAHWFLADFASFVSDAAAEATHSARSDELLAQALRTAPTNVYANAVKGYRTMLEEKDRARAAHYFKTALRRNPHDVFALGGARQLLTNLGRFELARRIGEYLVHADPVGFWPHAGLADVYLRLGDADRAIAEMRTAIALSPAAEAAHWNLGLALLVAGDAEGALREFEQEDPIHPYGRLGKVLAYHDLGRHEESERALADLRAFLEETDSPWSGLARAYAWLGDAGAAIEQLQILMSAEPARLRGELTHPLYARIRSDPRWPAFVASVGESPDDLAQIEFDPRLPAEVQGSEPRADRF